MVRKARFAKRILSKVQVSRLKAASVSATPNMANATRERRMVKISVPFL